MIKDLVSIIIPVYNVAGCLEKCLESVVKQTYRDIEIICINDGSTDDSEDILAEYAKNDSRFTIINKINQGLSAARNDGIKIANGEYVFCLDGDDSIQINAIEILYKRLILENADIACGNYIKISEEDERLEEPKQYEYCTGAGIDIYKHSYEGLYILCNVAWGKLYRTELFCGVSYPVGRSNEDEFTTYKLFVRANKVVLLPDVIYNYTIRNNSIMHTRSFEQYYDKLTAFAEKTKLMYEKGFDDIANMSLDMYISYFRVCYEFAMNRTQKKRVKKKLHDEYNNYKKKLSFTKRVKTKFFMIFADAYIGVKKCTS